MIVSDLNVEKEFAHYASVCQSNLVTPLLRQLCQQVLIECVYTPSNAGAYLGIWSVLCVDVVGVRC